MGRQHQGMDRPGVRQVPEGSGEQRKMEKTGCKIICGAPTTLAVKGKIMMIIMTNDEVRSHVCAIMSFEGFVQNKPVFRSILMCFVLSGKVLLFF